MMRTPPPEHPFAPYIRILGKGKNGSRSLTLDEAHDSMQMVMRDEVDPLQLGAFLIVLRVKEESPEEMAGFIRACKEQMTVPDVSVDLDWSSYAGKRRHLPWFILSALLLAENGISIFMHGASGHTGGRMYTEDAITVFGIQPCQSLEQAAKSLKDTHFAFSPLQAVSPKLAEIIEYRPLLGLRSPVHSIARQLNPFEAPYIMQGIFHPGYRPIHQETAVLLAQNNLCVIKGEGGEAERNPDILCLAQTVVDGELVDEEWPPLFKKRHVKDELMDPQRLVQVWSGQEQDEYGEASVTSTAALALKMMGKVSDQKGALQLAQDMWSGRDKNRYVGV